MLLRSVNLQLILFSGISFAATGCASSTHTVLVPQPIESPEVSPIAQEETKVAKQKAPFFDGATSVQEIAQVEFIDLVNFDGQATEVAIRNDQEESATQSEMTLEMFEQLALSNNPTIQQLSASASKAVAIRDQVSLKPNPTVGYSASQLADEGTDQHVFFFEQEIVRGNKLALNWSVLNQSAHAQLWEVEAQKLRVKTDVRRRFYEVLAAQQQLEVTQKFLSIAKQGVEAAKSRKAAGETSQVEVLQARIQYNEVALSIKEIEANYRGSWNRLVAMVGGGNLEPHRLTDQYLPKEIHFDWEKEYETLLQKSPELAAARTRVAEARAMLCRQEAQPIPNLFMQIGTGYDNSTDSGMLNLQLGAPIPVLNDNRGNISAAHAEYCRAAHDVQRIELELKSRLAEVSKVYESNGAAYSQLHNKILPDAEEMLSLSEQAYAAGELDFLQVLIVRKTYFDSSIRFIQVRNQLAKADALVAGLLLTGGLDVSHEFFGDDGLRGQSLGGQ